MREDRRDRAWRCAAGELCLCVLGELQTGMYLPTHRDVAAPLGNWFSEELYDIIESLFPLVK